MHTLTKPESTTYFIPSMVTLASAMFVENMIFLVSLGGGSKIRACSSGGNVAYSGRGRILGAAAGKLNINHTLEEKIGRQGITSVFDRPPVAAHCQSPLVPSRRPAHPLAVPGYQTGDAVRVSRDGIRALTFMCMLNTVSTAASQ
jgi:hypothetical protein